MPATQFYISSQTIARIVLTVLAIWFLYLIRDIIALFLVSVIITAALNPVIDRFSGRRMPRVIIVSSVFVLFFAFMGMLIAFMVPALTSQVSAFTGAMGQWITNLQTSAVGTILGLERLGDPAAAEGMREALSGSVGELFSRAGSFVSGMIAVLAVISMSFYMSLQKNGMKRFLMSVTPKQHQPYVTSLADRIYESFGRWMAGQVVTMIFVGTLYYIALSLFGVEYALVLAVLGGVLEIVPYLGPILSAIPAAILAFAISPAVGVGVLSSYALINLVENHVLIPQIMNKAVGLNPVAVILALLIGAKVAGLIGVIIAVPLAGAVSLFLKDVLEKKIG